MDRRRYKWFYDHVQCRYYDLLLKWCFLPLGGERNVRRALIDQVDWRPSETILDMCCGTGNATFAIAQKLRGASRIKGIDLSVGQINAATRKNRFPNVSFEVMDASDTSFPDQSFDKVVIPHALHEMPRAVRLAVLKEARRILRTGGTVVVLEIDRPPSLLWRLIVGLWWFYWLPFNIETATRRDMLKQGVAEELTEAGFRDVSKASRCNGTLQVATGRK
jgi:demethylmenaquinone methyltransferase/2-methoxy-6-polyprenyl-1,4-benzoquinol methylase